MHSNNLPVYKSKTSLGILALAICAYAQNTFKLDLRMKKLDWRMKTPYPTRVGRWSLQMVSGIFRERDWLTWVLLLHSTSWQQQEKNQGSHGVNRSPSGPINTMQFEGWKPGDLSPLITYNIVIPRFMVSMYRILQYKMGLAHILVKMLILVGKSQAHVGSYLLPWTLHSSYV